MRFALKAVVLSVVAFPLAVVVSGSTNSIWYYPVESIPLIIAIAVVSLMFGSAGALVLFPPEPAPRYRRTLLLLSLGIAIPLFALISAALFVLVFVSQSKDAAVGFGMALPIMASMSLLIGSVSAWAILRNKRTA
jgi:hypothetical protein